MRTYFALYNPYDYTWSIIYKDADSEVCNVYLADGGPEYVAKRTAEALNFSDSKAGK